MFLQPCVIILGIFAWCVQAASMRMVDCERYPFHSTCRGTMSKKSGVLVRPNAFREQDCDEFADDFPCTLEKLRSFEASRRAGTFHDDYDPYLRSKLWISLLDKDLDADALYDAITSSYERHHRKRKMDEQKYNERRIHFRQPGFSARADAMDNDY